jgi:hypothetical protein
MLSEAVVALLSADSPLRHQLRPIGGRTHHRVVYLQLNLLQHAAISAGTPACLTAGPVAWPALLWSK